ncbi:MAG TPA: hypothetical protein VIY86_04285, partial [Pirellulaceae bacterium]
MSGVAHGANGFVVGVEFIGAPVYNILAPAGSGMEPNLFPYQFTAAASPFAQSGALVGVTEGALQSAIVDAVQDAFRRAQISRSDRMLRVDIRPGRVDKSVGTVHLIGDASDLSNFGLATTNAALVRALNQFSPTYDNAVSITFAGAVGHLPQLSPGLQFGTLDSVVHAIAGTTAHEIAHTLGIELHDPAIRLGEYFPIMATTSTGLAYSERLRERRFLDLPNTQFFPPGSGQLNASVTDVFEHYISLTTLSDFNMDGVSSAADLAIWRTHVFEIGHTVRRGDANDDRRVDALDFMGWYVDQGSFVGQDPLDLPQITRVTYDPSSGQFALHLPASSEFLSMTVD